MSGIHSAREGLTWSQGPDSQLSGTRRTQGEGGLEPGRLTGARKLKGRAGFLVSHYATSSLKATQNPGVCPVLTLQEFGFEKHGWLAVKELWEHTHTWP